MDLESSHLNSDYEESDMDTSQSSRLSETSIKASGRPRLLSSEVSASYSNSDRMSLKSHSEAESEEPETKANSISRSKMFMLILLAVAAFAVGMATYFDIHNKEVDKFTTEYREFSSLILSSTSWNAEKMFETISSFGHTLTTFTNATNMHWPNITLPDFEARGFRNNLLSKAIQISFSPLVTVANHDQWEDYSVASQGWLTQSLDLQEHRSAGLQMSRHLVESAVPPIPNHIWTYEDGEPVKERGDGLDFGPGNYGPVWQQSPAPTDPSIINYDLLSNADFVSAYKSMLETDSPILSPVLDLKFLYSSAVNYNRSDPTSFLMSPIYSFLPREHHSHDHRDKLSGFLVAVIPWDRYFAGILPTGVNGIMIVVNNSCGDNFTYLLNGPEPIFLGKGDLHDPSFSELGDSASFADFMNYTSLDNQVCVYTMTIYPSSIMQAPYLTANPVMYTIVVVILFAFTGMVFVVYDVLVQRRQEKVAQMFKQTAAIVAAMFPSDFKDRILTEAEQQAKEKRKSKKPGKTNEIWRKHTAPKTQLKTFLDEAEGEKEEFESKPIADIFPETTVCFADLVGFTAWSSIREPCQVFTLLETIYQAYDEIAKRRKVFKVETIGDCYVAVTGLPDPRKDHAVVMCRFARDCLRVMHELTKKLEITLGPGTAELSMRFGLHSGPVTAGVLRGDNCRFQLFGDTVNLASRIESTGARDRVHVSQDTADLIIAAGKGHWIESRPEKVVVKGKGELQTYWLTICDRTVQSSKKLKSSGSNIIDDATSGGSSETDDELTDSKHGNVYALDKKTQRLVEWNTDSLCRLLKKVVARRVTSESYRAEGMDEHILFAVEKDEGKTALDEVVEIIHLPDFDATVASRINPETVELDEAVLQQLRDYISIIATMYRGNPFHNFEHASHVAMSVVELLSRIVAPELNEHEIGDDDKIASAKHDHTYGITSDPLTQFACVFAALIHDVDHVGVPNTQLVKENLRVASYYKGKSVAEQNSVDVAWNLLMDVGFHDLQAAIFKNSEEKQRFRQLIVNSVMATDIMDKDLKALRNERWDKAFKGSTEEESIKDAVNRKATIVIEHLIQASDVAHTMQHWHVYRKWNERLFHEMYAAYKNGRAEKDPSEFWYNGEIGFFDFYIIPLAKKLKDCGVFGVSSDEYLIYAEKNRKEWEVKGQEVVASMLEKYKSQFEAREETGVCAREDDDFD